LDFSFHCFCRVIDNSCIRAVAAEKKYWNCSPPLFIILVVCSSVLFHFWFDNGFFFKKGFMYFGWRFLYYSFRKKLKFCKDLKALTTWIFVDCSWRDFDFLSQKILCKMLFLSSLAKKNHSDEVTVVNKKGEKRKKKGIF